jgi:hypothetical protein
LSEIFVIPRRTEPYIFIHFAHIFLQFIRYSCGLSVILAVYPLFLRFIRYSCGLSVILAVYPLFLSDFKDIYIQRDSKMDFAFTQTAYLPKLVIPPTNALPR